MFKKIGKFFKKVFVSIVLFFNKAETSWIDKVLNFTETIKKAIENPAFDLAAELLNIDKKIISKVAENIEVIEKKLSYLGLAFEQCDSDDSMKKTICMVTSIVNAKDVSKKNRNEAFMQIALFLVEALGINVQSSLINARLGIEARYQVLKEAAKNQ